MSEKGSKMHPQLGSTCPAKRRPGGRAQATLCGHLLSLDGYDSKLKVVGASKINPTIGRILGSHKMYLETVFVSTQAASRAEIKCSKCILLTGRAKKVKEDIEPKKVEMDVGAREKVQEQKIPGLDETSKLLVGEALMEQLRGLIDIEKRTHPEISFASGWKEKFPHNCGAEAKLKPAFTKTYWKLSGVKVELAQEACTQENCTQEFGTEEAAAQYSGAKNSRGKKTRKVPHATRMRQEEDERWKRYLEQAGAEEAGAQEAGTQGASAHEAGSQQTGTKDAGAQRACTEEAGAQEAGAEEAGAQEAGTQEASAHEAGSQEKVELEARLTKVEQEGERLYHKLARFTNSGTEMERKMAVEELLRILQRFDGIMLGENNNLRARRRKAVTKIVSLMEAIQSELRDGESQRACTEEAGAQEAGDTASPRWITQDHCVKISSYINRVSNDCS